MINSYINLHYMIILPFPFSSSHIHYWHSKIILRGLWFWCSGRIFDGERVQHNGKHFKRSSSSILAMSPQRVARLLVLSLLLWAEFLLTKHMHKRGWERFEKQDWLLQRIQIHRKGLNPSTRQKMFNFLDWGARHRPFKKIQKLIRWQKLIE